MSIDAFCGVLLNVYRTRARWEEIVKMGYSASYDGPQGVGKTRNLVYDAFVMRGPKYKALKMNTYLDAPVAKDLEADYQKGITEQFVRFKARYESVVEYQSHPEFLELIYSNFGIYMDGKRARQLKREHFTQEERIYESNIKVGAELDNLFPNVLRKTAKSDKMKVNMVDEFVGLDRQYTDGILLSDTHRTKSVFISFRDCMQVKYHILEHKYMYTPKFLKRVYEFFGNQYFKKLDKILKNNIENKQGYDAFIEKAKKHKVLRDFLVCLQKYIRSIGFTKIYYLLEQGAAGFSRPGKDVKVFVLANDVPYYYDDRGLQKDYLPLGYRKNPPDDPPPEESKKRGRPKKNTKDNQSEDGQNSA